jgi:pyridoxal phosphate enzyme (YggS family)
VNRVLSDRLQALRARIRRAAEDAGRDPAAVRLVAVTKSLAPERADDLGDLIALGERDFGENRVQALAAKHAALAARSLAPRWHVIGHLQTNKARKAVELAHAIHSVDSPRLIEALERVAAELERRPRIFLEVRSEGGPERTGVAPSDLASLCDHARRATHLELAGLMTLAPLPDPTLTERENSLRAEGTFRGLAALARTLPHAAFANGKPELSIGMSSDFEVAIRAGADWVRVGSALFEGLER